jgi:hypothetical protein
VRPHVTGYAIFLSAVLIYTMSKHAGNLAIYVHQDRKPSYTCFMSNKPVCLVSTKRISKECAEAQ